MGSCSEEERKMSLGKAVNGEASFWAACTGEACPSWSESEGLLLPAVRKDASAMK